MAINRCTFCVTQWVDRALVTAGVQITELERRRSIATLLSRPHLILSGPPGIGEGRLVHALALSGVDGERDRVCWLQGHPWWAADTANVGRFIELQTDYSLSRLARFAHPALNSEGTSLRHDGVGPVNAGSRNGRHAGPAYGMCAFVACVERVSPVEIELYFRVVAEWLPTNGEGASRFVPLRLTGAFDGSTPPDLDERIRRVTGLVHLSGAQDSTQRDFWRDADMVSPTQA
jgi:hypothetical protein